MAEETRSVFLSYRRGEEPFVLAVAQELRRRGLAVGQYQRELDAGGSLPDSFLDEITSADIVVLFVSVEALTSSWVNFEIGAALGLEKQVVPVFLTEGVRGGASSYLSNVVGIHAYNLKPDEVAEQIVQVVDTKAA